MKNTTTVNNAAREAGQINPTTEMKDETIGGTIVAISSDRCWGKGDTVESAMHQCWKAGGSGLQNVFVYAYHGPRYLRQQITVNFMGDVEYPQGLVSIRVGMLKLNPGSQPKPKK